MAWTDERLQERFDSINRHFDQIDRRFDRLEREIAELRQEMRVELGALRVTLNRVGGGIVVGFAGVILAVLLQGGA
jgi:hypothetical protein